MSNRDTSLLRIEMTAGVLRHQGGHRSGGAIGVLGDWDPGGGGHWRQTGSARAQRTAYQRLGPILGSKSDDELLGTYGNTDAPLSSYIVCISQSDNNSRLVPITGLLLYNIHGANTDGIQNRRPPPQPNLVTSQVKQTHTNTDTCPVLACRALLTMGCLGGG